MQIRILQPSDQNRAPTEQLTEAWGRQHQIKNQLQEEKDELSKQNRALAEQLAEAQEGQRRLRHQLQQQKEATRAHQASTKVPSIEADISLHGVVQEQPAIKLEQQSPVILSAVPISTVLAHT